MLYKKNQAEKLEDSLFKQPTAEYRGAPFWAWNTMLDQKELDRQIEVLKSMGFGGAHLHPRTGLETPYLSEEFMDRIKGCLAKAKQENLQVYLYDEDRWPSGFAGGLVTISDVLCQFVCFCRYVVFRQKLFRTPAHHRCIHPGCSKLHI